MLCQHFDTLLYRFCYDLCSMLGILNNTIIILNTIVKGMATLYDQLYFAHQMLQRYKNNINILVRPGSWRRNSGTTVRCVTCVSPMQLNILNAVQLIKCFDIKHQSINKYSQTCIKQPHKRSTKSGCLRQVAA